MKRSFPGFDDVANGPLELSQEQLLLLLQLQLQHFSSFNLLIILFV